MKKYKITVDNLEDARIYFCQHHRKGRCLGCPLSFDKINHVQYPNGIPDKIDSSMWCSQFIQQYPDKSAEFMNVEIVEIKEPLKLTERELEICKAVGAKWVSRGYKSKDVSLWKSKPLLLHGDKYIIGSFITDMSANLFPTVESETIIKVEAN